MTASVHRLQFVHSATSMIMFHFCMAWLRLISLLCRARACTRASIPLQTVRRRAGHDRARARWQLLCRHELRGLQRFANFLVLLHAREGFRHVLGAAVPELHLNK